MTSIDPFTTVPQTVLGLVRALEESGYRADLVGGSVRDLLRGVMPHDYDLTTSARPEEIHHVFAAQRVVDTGIRHGTVTVVTETGPVEITTYRVDGAYADGRHPTAVSFTDSLVEDLARRDFTVNAMAYSPSHGLTDPFGGREDLASGILRTVGDPTIRFTEDALRILRALRFSATLGFRIDSGTDAALRSLRDRLSLVSVERIYSEFYKLLGGRDAKFILASYPEVIAVFLPEIADRIKNCKLEFAYTDAFTRLLTLFDTPTLRPLFAGACRRLHTDAHVPEVGSMAFLHREAPLSTTVDLAHLVSSAGEEAAYTVARLRAADGSSPYAVSRLSAFLASGAPYRISDLAVRGGDLAAIGFQGPGIGECLHRLLDAVIEGRVANTREALLAFATHARY